MVSSGQLTAMALAIVLPLAAAVLLYMIINRRSRKLETGLLGAAGYGLLGYLWQYLFYLMVIVFLSNLGWMRNILQSNFVVSALVYGLICSIFVALGMYWGTYLTNQKQKSLFRSAMIGLGFGVGNTAWNIVVPYSMSLYYSVQINAGNFAGQLDMKEKILSTSVTTMCVDAYRCILMLFIYTAVALVLGKFYLEGNRASAWGTPIIVQLLISLTNAFMQEFMPAVAARIGMLVVLTAMALYGGYLIFTRLRKDC